MRLKTCKWLKALASDKGGNMAMIVAFGMPALIGSAGLAVDVSQWYVWKRELQHSADQAALGAAWALASPASSANYKARALQEFNANQAITAGFASTPTVNLASYTGGTDNSVIVTASASKRLPFSGFLMGSPATVTVRSQASFAAGKKYSACLIAISKTGTGIDVGGNANVKAQCGLAALSCDSDAVQIDGSATVRTDSIATCGTASVPDANKGVVTEHVHGLEDVYDDLPPPDDEDKDKSSETYSCNTTGTGNNKTTIATPVPGTYKGGIVVKCTTVLHSGIYVIDGGVLDLSANYNVTGTNVMFVLKHGARLKLGGEGNNNKITLTPMEASDFYGTPYAAQADRYAGILIFEDRDNNPPQPGHQMTGNSNSLIEGLIYLPSGEMSILGTADVAAQCLQISAYKIHVKGNASLETLCPTADSTSVGASGAVVKLVA